MSLSPQKRARVESSEADFKETQRCPECGKKSLGRVQSDCKLLDGTVIKNLLRYYCDNCHSNFFDDEAMREIRRQRRKKSKRLIRR
jgi:uncharacterized protein with PIN domain